MDKIDVALIATAVLLVLANVVLFAAVRRRTRKSEVVDTYEDVLFRCLDSGNIVIGNIRDDGRWDVKQIPERKP